MAFSFAKFISLASNWGISNYSAFQKNSQPKTRESVTSSESERWVEDWNALNTFQNLEDQVSILLGQVGCRSSFNINCYFGLGTLLCLTNQLSKRFILITSIIFILLNVVLSPNTYSGFSSMFLHGSIHLLPWQMVTSIIFYHAVMPLLLVVLTIMVFREKF